MSKTVYKINGKVVTPEEFRSKANKDWLQAPPHTANTYTEHDPLLSEGAGCMKSQVGEMRDVIKKHNIKGVAVKESGQLVITSRRGRKELLKVRGLADADGGYSD